MSNEKTKLIEMDAGRSLRILMAENNTKSVDLENHFQVSKPTITRLRKGKYISARWLKDLSAYFGISASDFIRKGEAGR